MTEFTFLRQNIPEREKILLILCLEQKSSTALIFTVKIKATRELAFNYFEMQKKQNK